MTSPPSRIIARHRIAAGLVVSVLLGMTGCATGGSSHWRDATPATPPASASPTVAYDPARMVDFCNQLEREATDVLGGRGFDLEQPEVLKGDSDPNDDPLDGWVRCGWLSDNLTGDIVSQRALGVSIFPVRRHSGESLAAYVKRFVRYERSADIVLEPLEGVGGDTWMEWEVKLPHHVNATVYAVAEPYLVKIYVAIRMVEKGEDKADKRCMDMTKSLVRHSFNVLSR